MKKSTVLLMLLTATVISHAQTLVIGLKGGLNASSIDNSGNAAFSNRLGFNGGLFMTVPINQTVAIQPEVVYSAQGAKYNLGGTEEHNLALNYINIPVMVQVNIGSGVYAEAGPQLGLLTSVNDKFNSQETGYFSSQDFKKTDVAIGLGVGYRTGSSIGVNARYNLGLTDINNYGTNTIRNNNLQVGLTFGFGR